MACVAALLAAAAPALAAPPLIPTPRSIALALASRPFAHDCAVSSDAPRADAYACGLLRDLAARGPEGAGRPAITRIELRTGRSAALPAGAVAAQSYELACAGDRIVIRGETAAARLHGAETLRQLWLTGGGRVPAGRIVDGPALALRGLSLDLSRGRMPSYADLLATLDLCAAFKLNTLQLYFEDTFAWSRVPADAQSPWALDALALRRLTAEARRRSIELIPIVETLAHQEQLLAHPSMQAFAEHGAPDGRSAMFAVTERPARALVASMVDDVLAASGATAVHLGCDEPAELGHGASARAVRRLGVERVFAAHVCGLAARVRARFGARAWIYADLVRARPSLAAMLPRDLVLMDWDYDPDSRYASLDTLAAAGLDRVVTSPGLWTWNTPYPDYTRAGASIVAATAAARVHGCLGSVLASWGDGGGEDLFGSDVLGVAFFAEHAWQPDPSPLGPFLSRYAALRFGEDGPPVARALERLTSLTVPNGARGRQLTDHPILVRPRTEPWRSGVRALEQDLTEARAALAGRAGRDVLADAELDAMRAAVGRLLAAAARERVLDSLAVALADPGTAQNPEFARRAGEALAQLRAGESAAQVMFAGAWRAHNLESGLPAIQLRFQRQLAVLDSLEACAARGMLRVARPGEGSSLPVAGSD